MWLKWMSTGLAAMCLPTAVLGQNVIGSTIVEGRHVQLMSDFTWKYETPTASTCQGIEDGVSFCGVAAGWTQIEHHNKEIAAQFRLNDRNYGVFIVGKLGSDDGISTELLLDLAIKNAAQAANMQAKDVTTVGPESAVVDGLPGETISYFLKIESLPAVFTNTIVVDKHRAVQIVTYGFGQTLSDEMKLNHKNFLAATHLK